MTEPPPTDAIDVAGDARRLLASLERELPAAAVSGECRPPLDVMETADAVEIVLDVPGISLEFLRVAVRKNLAVIVGVKREGPAASGARYHLAERASGQFARIVRLPEATDATRAKAVVSAGQLRVTIPRVTERRGAVIHVPLVAG
jgi:HSP20 family protein